MRRPRLLFGVLHPGSSRPLLLLPDGDGGGGDGGGGGGAGGSGGAPPPPNPPPPPPAPTDRGFPEGVAPESMTAPEQAAYWRWRSRQNEDKGKEALAWKTANEAKVRDYDALLAASQTDQEKAIAAAKAEATAAGRAALVPQLVAAEFLAAAKGALTREQVTDLIAPLDTSKFLDEHGSVDTAKVTAWVEKFAPVAGNNGGGGGTGSGSGGTGGRRWPGTNGQGPRGGNSAQAPSVQSGRDYYARMKGKQTTP